MHPVLDALEHTPEQWLRNLLLCFNEGNIAKFDSLTPLFPKEVKLSCHPGANSDEPSLAHPPTIVSFPPPEDLLNGTHRNRVPKKGA